jgi:hypothetical protein
MDLVKTLNEITNEVKQLTEKLQTYDNMKEVFDNTLKMSLFKCVMEDCEVSIVEYILAETYEKANELFGWENWDGCKIERIMDEEDFINLIKLFKVRTVDEDMD